MLKEVISRKQAISIIILYWLGSILILGTTEAGKDLWIAIIIATIVAIPVLFLYSRLMKLYPGKDFFDISMDVFGKIGGKILILFYIEYALHLSALETNNYSGFFNIGQLPETPQYIFAIMLVAVCIVGAKMGLEVIGRWAEISIFFVLLSVILITLLSIPYFDFSNVMPILYNGWKPVIGASFTLSSFPFAEAVIIIYILSALKQSESIYKVVFSSLVVTSIILMMLLMKIILVLGENSSSMYYFPSQQSISIIDIGDFIQRLDIFSPLVYFLNYFVKITICLIFASKGVTKLFNLREYKKIVVPLGFFVFVFSLIIYNSTMDAFADAKYYKYYAFPFQFIFPIMILIVAEIKNLINKKRAV